MVMFEFVEYRKEGIEITPEYIIEFQKKYNIEIPEALKLFYINYNRAKLKENNSFVMYNSNLEFNVAFILPITGANICLEKKLMNKNWAIGLPETFIPFAEDIDDGLYYWDAIDEKVYYLVMENAENYVHISNNIKEFFEILSNAVKHTGQTVYIAPVPNKDKEAQEKLRMAIERKLLAREQSSKGLKGLRNLFNKK